MRCSENRIFDEVDIEVFAGSGGGGCVSFRREKFVSSGGPNGGNGGRGGDVAFRVNDSLNTLQHFRFKRRFVAEDGGSGKSYNKTGKNGGDLFVEVPLGTEVVDFDSGCILFDFVGSDDEFTICRGGQGGRGNYSFRSSINQSPRFFTLGAKGGSAKVGLRLKMFCDIGLIGLPNAGKSTLISIVTASKAKSASYAFTTLSPNLGVFEKDYRQFIIGDIPGIVDGACNGRGLGDSFLKHIERCKVLVHLIDISCDDPFVAYQLVRKEISGYDDKHLGLDGYTPILSKKEYVVLNKSDLLSPEECSEKRDTLQGKLTGMAVVLLSNVDQEEVCEMVNNVVDDLAAADLTASGHGEKLGL